MDYDLQNADEVLATFQINRAFQLEKEALNAEVAYRTSKALSDSHPTDSVLKAQLPFLKKDADEKRAKAKRMHDRAGTTPEGLADKLILEVDAAIHNSEEQHIHFLEQAAAPELYDVGPDSVKLQAEQEVARKDALTLIKKRLTGSSVEEAPANEASK
jgi:hypothetical protein